MNSRRTSILTTSGVAVMMLVLGVALGSVLIPSIETRTTTATQQETSSQTVVLYRSVTVTHNITSTVTSVETALDYPGPDAVIAVTCCEFPTSFVVGSDYLFQPLVESLPTTTVNGVVSTNATFALLTFEITYDSQGVGAYPNYPVPSGLPPENVTFSWNGTFSSVPYPSNATAFSGTVRMTWFTNSTSLKSQIMYLRIETPLNFAAYQIQESGTAAITLLYSFPANSGTGVLNLTSSSTWGNLSVSANSYTACGVEFNISLRKCNLAIIPTKSEMPYYPLYNATITFTIIANSSSAGYYLFSPGGGGGSCGYTIFLIVGNKIPSSLPGLTYYGCSPVRPTANIVVMGIENMTGLYIPY